MRRVYKIGLLIPMFFLWGCMKDDTGIPNVLVDFYINPQFSGLNAPINHEMVDNKGVLGIIIYNTGSGYRAYDRYSTINPENPCQVIIGDKPWEVIDPCNGGAFDLNTGYATLPPAKVPLKSYYVTENKLTGMLHIRNQ